MVLSMDKWVGKVAIVTGASSGIGAAICDVLVEHGLLVAGIARRAELVEERAKELAGKKGKLFAVKGDVSKEEEILRAFKWIGNNLGLVNILVNNAGIVKEALLTEGKLEDWKKVFDVNVFGLCVATREAVQIMKANNINGHIIHINSVAGHMVPEGFRSNVYAASKHAVTALTETMRKELNSQQSKIKVTSLSPGFVATELTTYSKKNSQERQKFIDSLPFLLPMDIADGVVYLLSTPEHVQVHELTIKPVGEPF